MINLDVTKTKAFVEGGVTVEIDDKATVSEIMFDYMGNTASLTVNYGGLVSSVFTEGSRTGKTRIFIDLLTGAVSLGNGQVLGALNGTQLNSLQNTAKNLRNNAESFLTNSSLILGTTTAW